MREKSALAPSYNKQSCPRLCLAILWNYQFPDGTASHFDIIAVGMLDLDWLWENDTVQGMDRDKNEQKRWSWWCRLASNLGLTQRWPVVWCFCVINMTVTAHPHNTYTENGNPQTVCQDSQLIGLSLTLLYVTMYICNISTWELCHTK